jgi:uncharacterized protein
VSKPGLPTRAEALSFLAKAGCSQSVINHCKTVSKFAVRLGKAFQREGYTVDLQLIEVSGLLHDIGRSKTHSVNHGVIGGEIVKSLGLPDSVVKVVERHVGGGVPKEEAKRLGWPARDFLPVTLEEKIVCYADKRVEGLRVVPMTKALKPYINSLGENHPAVDRIRKLHEEIVAAVGDVS